MKISYLSGIGSITIGALSKQEQDEVTIIIDNLIKLRDNYKKSHPNHPHEEAFNRRIRELYSLLKISGIGKHKGKSKTGKGGVKKILASPLRNSFLAVVALNGRGLASKLAKQLAKNPAALETLWEKKLGGKFSKLKSVIASGAKKKPLFGESKKSRMQGIEGIEFIAGPELAAALALAAPVVIAVGKLLKANGLDTNLEGGATGSDLDALVDDSARGFEKQTGESAYNLDSDKVEIEDKGKGEDHGGGVPMWVYLGGGALLIGGAIYFISSKKS